MSEPFRLVSPGFRTPAFTPFTFTRRDDAGHEHDDDRIMEL
jgi:hypothetical protein